MHISYVNIYMIYIHVYIYMFGKFLSNYLTRKVKASQMYNQLNSLRGVDCKSTTDVFFWMNGDAKPSGLHQHQWRFLPGMYQRGWRWQFVGCRSRAGR